MEAGTAQVEEGVKKTERTGESLQEIIRMNDRVRDMINQIATTTAEQSATSSEVSAQHWRNCATGGGIV